MRAGGGGGGGELLLLLLLLALPPLKGLLGLRLLDLRDTFRGLGESEKDDDLPRLTGGRPLRGENDLEFERAGLRIGERLRLRPMGDLLGGLRARLGGGERRLGGGGGERLRPGLPRNLLGETLAGDLRRLGGDGERPLPGDTGLLLGGVSPPRR